MTLSSVAWRMLSHVAKAERRGKMFPLVDIDRRAVSALSTKELIAVNLSAMGVCLTPAGRAAWRERAKAVRAHQRG